tara:strand:+ start:106 stop:660 length:555 start_codon:yes stop_codon:yes gene_type:complete
VALYAGLSVPGMKATFIMASLSFLINSYKLIQHYYEECYLKVPEPLRSIFQEHFSCFTPRQFLTLWSLGTQKKLTGLVYHAGDPGTEVSFIIDGAATVHLPKGQEISLGTNSWLGEMSLLSETPITTDVSMKKDTTVMIWDKETTARIKQDLPNVFKSLEHTLTRHVCSKIRNMNDLYANQDTT